MKITNEHYALLKQQMKDGIAHLSNLNRISAKQWLNDVEEKYAGYTETRKLWGVYWGTGGNDWHYLAFNDNEQPLSSRWTIPQSEWIVVKFGFDCTARNDAGYHDSHLETAIKKAYYEIKKETHYE